MIDLAVILQNSKIAKKEGGGSSLIEAERLIEGQRFGLQESLTLVVFCVPDII